MSAKFWSLASIPASSSSSLVGGFSEKPKERVTAVLSSCLVEADAKLESLDRTDDEADADDEARDSLAS